MFLAILGPYKTRDILPIFKNLKVATTETGLKFTNESWSFSKTSK